MTILKLFYMPLVVIRFRVQELVVREMHTCVYNIYIYTYIHIFFGGIDWGGEVRKMDCAWGSRKKRAFLLGRQHISSLNTITVLQFEAKKTTIWE